MLGGWFTTAEWARAHPDVIARFVRVIAEASTYVDAHTTETAPVLSDFTGVPVGVILKMQRTIHPQTVLRAQDIQPIIDAAAKYKLIPRAFSAQELITH
jgi:ABC-type nitrate/sulfonate/bicarbonate transport system substrate-binding protein